MAILIDIKFPQWLKDEELQRELSPLLSGADMRTGDAPGKPEDVEMLIVSNYQPDEARKYPNLKLIQKTGAGIENILADKNIPAEIRIARSNAEPCAREMAEFALAFVLQEHRQLRTYQNQQARSNWAPYAPAHSKETTVTTLGLGRMGCIVATHFASNHFRAAGWSRTQKDIPGVECFAGTKGLQQVLEISDYVVAVLPTTAETNGLFNAGLFEQFKRGSVFINIGRGNQVNEADLIDALDCGHLSAAVLDVCVTEPLPEGDPLWTHPKVQITPHVSGWHSYVAADLAEN